MKNERLRPCQDLSFAKIALWLDVPGIVRLVTAQYGFSDIDRKSLCGFSLGE